MSLSWVAVSKQGGEDINLLIVQHIPVDLLTNNVKDATVYDRDSVPRLFFGCVD